MFRQKFKLVAAGATGTLLVALLSSPWMSACKHRSQRNSGLTAGSNLTPAQKAVLDELRALDRVPDLPVIKEVPKSISQIPVANGEPTSIPPSPFSLALAGEPSASADSQYEPFVPGLQVKVGETLARLLKPQSDGTLVLTIDGLDLVIDPQVKDKGQAPVFFPALARAVERWAKDPGFQPGGAKRQKHQNMAHLIQSHRAGDLDPSRQPLLRDGVQKGEIIEVKIVNEKGEDKFSRFVDLPYKMLRQRYVVNGLVKLAELSAEPSALKPKRRVDLAKGGEACRARKTVVAPSLTAFKKGDFDRSCAAFIDQAIERGFMRVTLFPPVHYAGDARQKNIVDKKTDETFPKVSKAGHNYRIERLLAPDREEVTRCVTAVLDAGLELTYIPHLEAIQTMISEGEAEWRIFSNVPMDDPTLFELGYQPLVDALSERSGKSSPTVTVSISAETDNSFIYYPDAVLRLSEKISNAIKLPQGRLRRSFNPNGDPHHLACVPPSHYQKRGIDVCEVLGELFLQQIDLIGPSVYDAYQHVYPLIPQGDKNLDQMAEKSEFQFLTCVDGVRYNEDEEPTPEVVATPPDVNPLALTQRKVVVPAPSLARTAGAILRFWEKELDRTCGGMGSAIKKRFTDRVGMGEFSLQGERADSYKTFFEQALEVQRRSGMMQINLWTSGQDMFDPFAPSKDPRAPPSAAKGILDFLKCDGP